jgi:hypothetical protein
MTNTLAKRKAYAINCLIRGGSATTTRAFDNCFENYDGDKVVQHILNYVDGFKPEDLNSYDRVTYKSAKNRQAARQTLIDKGFEFYKQHLATTTKQLELAL